MKWFTGSIPEAIQSSKSKKSVFIVYVHGEDDLSTQMSSTWEDDQVISACEANNAVAVKILANSEACGFFSQIYPVIVVPSTFFIGEGGVPLEVTGGYVESAEFIKKMESVFQEHKRQLQGAAGDSSQVLAPTSGASNSEVPAEIKEEPASTSSQDLADRLQKAEELIEEKRKEKMKQDEEKVRKTEIERRRLGQEVQSLRQHQKDMELKEVQDQMKKDKEEERQARARIREQIAKDREERASKFKKEKDEREKNQETAKRARLQEQQEAAVKEEARKSETARIQVRLPDGSSISQTFQSGDPLQNLNDFVTQQLGAPATLSTTFPKKVFTEEDMSRSFADLQLAPTAVVIAVTARQVRPPSANSGSDGVVSILLTPFMLLWRFLYYVYCLLFGGGSGPQSPNSPQASQGSSSGTRSQTNMRSEGSGVQRRTTGNMHRLTDMRDDDDENATWNGNSTQQL